MIQFESVPSRRYLIGHMLYFCAWLGVSVVALMLQPSINGHGTHQQLGLPPCPSVLLYSRPCPGCGLTTSWSALAHGQVAEAFRAHAIGPLVYLVFTITAWMNLYGYIKLKRFNSNTDRWNRFMIALVVVFFVSGLWRFTVDRTVPTVEPTIWRSVVGK